MLGFVPQQVHRQRASEASAQDTDGEQALLRDPPPPGFCCHLVIGIHAETENVQQDENCCDESLHVCYGPFFDAGSMLYYTSNLFCCGQIILQPRCLDDCPLLCYCGCFQPVLPQFRVRRRSLTEPKDGPKVSLQYAGLSLPAGRPSVQKAGRGHRPSTS